MTMEPRHPPLGYGVSLCNLINQLLESSGITLRSQRAKPFLLTSSGPIDVEETDDNFVVKAFTPDVSAEQIQISIAEDSVTISGEAKTGTARRTGGLRNENQFHPFTPSFRPPLPIEADKVEATMDKGALLQPVPQTKSSKPHKILVKSV